MTEESHPMRSSLTHLALHVRSIEASVAFYEGFTSLRVVERHSDTDSTGMEVAWLGEPHVGEARADFVLVLQEGTPRFPAGAEPQSPLAPISHLGFASPSREVVDEVASRAERAGILRFGPEFLNPNAGYLCIVADPDGHHVEISHGQALGPYAGT